MFNYLNSMGFVEVASLFQNHSRKGVRRGILVEGIAWMGFVWEF